MREAAGVAKGFDVFPSTEACLTEARTGIFAGCISATANLNADLCQKAWQGDAAAQETAVTIRNLFNGKALVSGIKSTLAHVHNDAGWARMAPPLAPSSRPPTRLPRTRATMRRGQGGSRNVPKDQKRRLTDAEVAENQKSPLKRINFRRTRVTLFIPKTSPFSTGTPEPRGIPPLPPSSRRKNWHPSSVDAPPGKPPL